MSDYWSEEEFLRPAFVDDVVWQQILNNFLNTIGDPVTNLPSELSDDIQRLQDMGISQPSDYMALLFEIEQAGDFGSLTERKNRDSIYLN